MSGLVCRPVRTAAVQRQRDMSSSVQPGGPAQGPRWVPPPRPPRPTVAPTGRSVQSNASRVAATGPASAASAIDFSSIRYAQCWEDADVLLEALDIRPGDTCLSIASAGDNTLAMLAKAPGRVIAVDVSAAQLACLQLRVAAYRSLEHGEVLELLGSVPSRRRDSLYRRCRPALSPEARRFWDARPEMIRGGAGNAGKLERYLSLFRRAVLPAIHPRRRVERLLQGGRTEERLWFYEREWNTRRWRWAFRLFFSRPIAGRLGRDPRMFRYVEGGLAQHLLERTRHALTVLDPPANPYLQWILTGRHGPALPYALRPENFDAIRSNLDRLEWHCSPIEDFLDRVDGSSIDRFNGSDMFEYMSTESYRRLLERLVESGRTGGRLVYWNMLVPRSRPPQMAGSLQPLPDVAGRLHARDKAFFYRALQVEELR